MNTFTDNSRSRAYPRIPTWTKTLLAAAIFAMALYFLFHRLEGISQKEIALAMHGMSAREPWTCGALTAISFLALGSYDVIGVRVVAACKISSSRAWLTGAVANAISNTLGFHFLTAPVVRYRLLARSGLSGPEVTGITALSWTALAFGFTSVLSLSLAVSPKASQWQMFGSLLIFGMLLLCVRWLGAGKLIHLGQYSLRLPSRRLALAQMLLGAIEMASAIGGLYVLMPEGSIPSFPAFSTLYISAVLLGIASHAPGGLGVFEAAILTLSNEQNRAGILAALLLYRLIYNLCPFLIGILVLAGDEMRAAVNSSVDKV